MNFWYRFQRFMSGRYGIDNMFYLLVAISAILSFLNLFIRSIALQLIVYIVIVYAFLRVMSRNYDARTNENKWFMSIFKNCKKKIDVSKQRRADITHIYKKCPNCKAVLRLPRRSGRHTTTCPKCNTSFKVNVK